jgi:hypothetical protein
MYRPRAWKIIFLCECVQMSSIREALLFVTHSTVPLFIFSHFLSVFLNPGGTPFPSPSKPSSLRQDLSLAIYIITAVPRSLGSMSAPFTRSNHQISIFTHWHLPANIRAVTTKYPSLFTLSLSYSYVSSTSFSESFLHRTEIVFRSSPTYTYLLQTAALFYLLRLSPLELTVAVYTRTYEWRGKTLTDMDEWRLDTSVDIVMKTSHVVTPYNIYVIVMPSCHQMLHSRIQARKLI